MADYFKLRVIGTYSPNADYSDPFLSFDWTQDERPNEVILRRVEAVTGGTTVNTTDLDSPLLTVVVFNRDDTNYVDVDYTEGNAGSATPTIRLLAGQMCVLPDVDPAQSVLLTANTAACMCEVAIIGS